MTVINERLDISDLELLKALEDDVNAHLVPLKQDDEFSISQLAKLFNVSHPKAKKIIAENIKNGKWVMVGNRRFKGGGKSTIVFKKVK